MVTKNRMAYVQTTVTKYDELQLVRNASAGDEAAYDSLVRIHSERIFRLALRMLGTREDAEDVQQETFIQAYMKLNKFRGESAFGTWLYGIASKICLTRLRRTARGPQKVQVDPEMPAADGTPEERLLASESAGRTRRTLECLSPADRLLIVLKYVEDLSHEEIAGILGCSVQSSWSRLLRAKKLFRKYYERM